MRDKRKKPKLVQVIEPPLCPYWHFDTFNGRVVVYAKRGDDLTLANANYMLDLAKSALLHGCGVQDKPA